MFTRLSSYARIDKILVWGKGDLWVETEEYKFGSGRYWQENSIITRTGSEAGRFGHHAYILAGTRAWSAAGGPVAASFEALHMPYNTHVYSGVTSSAKVESLCKDIRKQNCDVVVGIGGGRIMDLAKSAAVASGTPVITVPTSAATCAAFAPLSILYQENGAYDRCVWHDREVDAVIVDNEILMQQPPRLLIAGMLDAMAKSIELTSGGKSMSVHDVPISLHSAYHMACYTYDFLSEHLLQAAEDLRNRQHTKLLDDVFFLNIALTGIISGITKGKGQTALAHALYNGVRRYFPERSRPYLHGEIVAVGLLAQCLYNHAPEQREQLLGMMKQLQVPCSLSELGLTPDRDTVEQLSCFIAKARFAQRDGADAAVIARALATIC